jgi:DNA-binding MarR family transcriptional regulator
MTFNIGHMTDCRGLTANMFEALFESSVKEKALLFIYARGPSYAREIARIFAFNLSAVQNQLLKLEAGGVLFSQLKGRVRLFGLNPRFAFKSELEALLEKALAFLPDDERRVFQGRLRPRRTGKPI